MIINESGDKETPKKAAIRIMRNHLDYCCIEDETDQYESLSKKERELIKIQYRKICDRIVKRYLNQF